MSAYPRHITERSIGNADQQNARWVAGHAPLFDPIQVVEPDPAWPDIYHREADRIVAVLGDEVIRIEHVGSTSVPGLPAKPIIDIDLQVRDSEAEQAYVPALEQAGYTHVFASRGGTATGCSSEKTGRSTCTSFLSGHRNRCATFCSGTGCEPIPTTGNCMGPRRRASPPLLSMTPIPYNLAKNDVIDEIYSRIFSVPPDAHPAWPERPEPR